MRIATTTLRRGDVMVFDTGAVYRTVTAIRVVNYAWLDIAYETTTASGVTAHGHVTLPTDATIVVRSDLAAMS